MVAIHDSHHVTSDREAWRRLLRDGCLLSRERLEEGVFRNIDFNSEAALGRTRQRNERLRNLLSDFADPRLDLRPSHVGDMDVIGNAYEYLIGRSAGSRLHEGREKTPGSGVAGIRRGIHLLY